MSCPIPVTGGGKYLWLTICGSFTFSSGNTDAAPVLSSSPSKLLPSDPHGQGLQRMPRRSTLFRLGQYPTLTLWRNKLVKRQEDSRIHHHLTHRKSSSFTHCRPPAYITCQYFYSPSSTQSQNSLYGFILPISAVRTNLPPLSSVSRICRCGMNSLGSG